MDDKELYEILQKYAEDIKSEKESAFKKLNEKPNEEVKKSRKRFKLQYAFAVTICMIVVVLCIALPITLTGNPQDVVEPTYCWSEDIDYQQEESITSIIENYHINAFYPTIIVDTENMLIGSIISKNDESLHGVKISYIIEDEWVLFIDFAIVPITHILQTYECYFSLQNQLKWKNYDIKFFKEYNEETLMYDMQIYFTDGIYDYFITVESDEDMDTDDLLNLLYN